jgi:hypothetical protein
MYICIFIYIYIYACKREDVTCGMKIPKYIHIYIYTFMLRHVYMCKYAYTSIHINHIHTYVYSWIYILYLKYFLSLFIWGNNGAANTSRASFMNNTTKNDINSACQPNTDAVFKDMYIYACLNTYIYIYIYVFKYIYMYAVYTSRASFMNKTTKNDINSACQPNTEAVFKDMYIYIYLCSIYE